MTGMNLDVHAAWTRRTDTPHGHTGNAVQTHRSTLGAEPTAQNPPCGTHGAETAKKHTHPSKNQGAFSGNLP